MGTPAGDQLGHSVALSSDGSTVAMGANMNDKGTDLDAGHVRVYEWDGTAWNQLGGDIEGEAAGDQSGYSVALSSDGSTVAIGALLNDGGGTNSGHVRVFDLSSNVWVQRGADIDGEAAGDWSGYAVALSADGDTVAIGAPKNDGGGTDDGHVRVYEWDGGATPPRWTQLGGDIDGGGGEQSGFSVALSSDGSTVAIGAPLNDDPVSNSGLVRVFEFVSNAWVQQGGDIEGEAVDDRLGFSVALSSDGSTVAIGAPQHDPIGTPDAGRVRVYRRNGTAWVQRGGTLDGEASDDQSGSSVALSADGDTVAIGAKFNDGGGTHSGHVRVWAFPAVVGTVAAAPPSVSCVPSVPVAGGVVACTVTGGDAGIDILWRAAYNPVIAETGVTLDASGSGTFLFTVPAAALGEELTVELVEWIAPVSLGVVGGPVPTSVPSGQGPVPVWPLGLLTVAGAFLGGLTLRSTAKIGPARSGTTRSD